MSYADAAGAKAHTQKKFFNENMVICLAGKIAYERLAEELNKQGYWKAVTGFQKVDFHRRYTVVFNDPVLRDRLVVNGLNIDGSHVGFAYHQRRIDPTIRVFVTQLPLGISSDQIRFVLDHYGEVLTVQQVTKFMFGKRIDTGNRVVIFKKLHKDILFYLLVRGWKAFIMYAGQPKTCRICEKTGHFAKDCPSKSKSKPDERPTENKSITVNMETESFVPLQILKLSRKLWTL